MPKVSVPRSAPMQSEKTSSTRRRSTKASSTVGLDCSACLRDVPSPMMPSACCDVNRPVSSVLQPNGKLSMATHAPRTPSRITSRARNPLYDEPSWYETRYPHTPRVQLVQ